ncbi:DUF1287 domain-containing protein [Marinoscillum sp.]|uniref:DUF1287 domain-containing protein n=1 Tax=Marinoscillum sp. TaxID=2024838 RepID=UPI003BAC5857
MKSLVILCTLLPSLVFSQTSFYEQLADSAETLTQVSVVYDPSYFSINYPNGDVPEGKGVCTDVVIRAYRKLGIDLQKEVHEDMKTHFDRYPTIWGLSTTDKNIDHRRVPNLMTFFERYGITLPLSTDPDQYLPGDIVCWNLGGAVTHIGIVSDEIGEDTGLPMIVHNIGRGQVIEDMLFDYQLIGHYRYQPLAKN